MLVSVPNSLALSLTGFLSIPLHVCCTYFRHMPPLGIMSRFEQNKCRSHYSRRPSDKEGDGLCECGWCCGDGAEIQFYLSLCKNWPHFWVMFWYGLSHCLLGIKMSHAWRAWCTPCASHSSAFFGFFFFIWPICPECSTLVCVTFFVQSSTQTQQCQIYSTSAPLALQVWKVMRQSSLETSTFLTASHVHLSGVLKKQI